MLVAEEVVDAENVITLADHFAEKFKKIALTIFLFTKKMNGKLMLQRHSMTPPTVSSLKESI